MNLYGYVGGMPTGYVDPYGLEEDGLVRNIVPPSAISAIVPTPQDDLPVLVQQALGDPDRYRISIHAGGQYYIITDLKDGSSQTVVSEAILPLHLRQSGAARAADAAATQASALTLTAEAMLTLPVASDYRDVNEAITGRDLNTGRKLTFEERHSAAMFSLLPIGSAAHARHGQRACDMLTGAAPDGIIYRRIDLNGGINPYIGQSKNDARFLERQAEHARKHPDAEFKFEIVDRAAPGDALDIAEHQAIQNTTGGQGARHSPAVSNLKDPVGPKRRPGFGLPEPRK